MKSHYKAIVIGGGVVGCSVLYHLTKAGWSDVLLVERSQLTSGSTWHAAGGFLTLNGDPNVAKLQAYTIELYDELERISGQSCGLHRCGGLLMADSQERMDWLKMAHARSAYLGLETELLTPAQAKARMPLLDDSKFAGAMWDAAEGNLDPSGTTHAYAKSARIQGAEIELENRVIELNPRTDGGWDVVTEKGTVACEHVINCGGLWAREIGRMVGIELPVLAMEHMYLVTDDMPDVIAYKEEHGADMPMIADFGAEIYMRQERSGMLLGTYEQDCRPWSPRDTPWDFAAELLPPDLDRITPSLEKTFESYPAMGQAGIKNVVNGPFTFAPDGNPLVGPVQGLSNYWCACGVMAGFSQGGGVGLSLANWMVNGDPGGDIWAMDVARYGDWATRSYTNEKVRENYSKRFSIKYPNEERPAARPHQTTPLFDVMIRQGAVMGDNWGLEVPLWFAPEGVEPIDIFSFRRSNDFAHVKAEVLNTRERVGVTEIANFAKYEITGPGAESYLSRLMTNKMPRTGRICLTPMLNEQGKLIGDFTIAKAADDRFMMWGSAPAQVYHMRWFEKHLPDDQSVRVERLDLGLVGLSIAGPKSRDVLASLTDEDVSNAGFRFMDYREIDVASVPAKVNRISYTGDLGFELWIKPEYERRLYTAIMSAGESHGIVNFGMRALLAMRLEKNFPTWYRELRPIYGPFEAGMDRFIDLTKNDFIGREMAQAEHDDGGRLARVTFVVDADDADVIGDEPVSHNGEVIGWVTSGGYGHYVDASLAQGYIPKQLVSEKAGFEIEIMGDMRPARIQHEPLFDPAGERMRS